MQKFARKLVAVLLGTLITVLLVVPWGCRSSSGPQARVVAADPLAEAARGTSIELSLAPETETCPGVDGGLRMTRTTDSDSWDVHHQLVSHDVSEPGPSARARFSSSWAEALLLDAQLEAGGASVLLTAFYTTDYADFPGCIQAAGSSVHRHDDRLCFDLSVDRLSGTGCRERWRGVLPSSSAR